MTNATKIAFLGLGVMGGPIARHVGTAGHELTIYNRTPARADKWREAKERAAASAPHTT